MTPDTARLGELARLFFRLGATAFGGPAAHIAMMYDEVVQRRKWIDDQEFLDLIGATSLIPGPSSTEMTMHIGYVRAGWRGLIVAGSCFIFPAAVIVLTLAWLYVEFGNLPTAEWLLYGVKPVVIAVVFQALWTLGQKAVKGWLTASAGILMMVGYFLGFNEIMLLFVGGIAVMVIANIPRLMTSAKAVGLLALAPFAGLFQPGGTASEPGLLAIFLTFLKIGSVLYGSGYVLLAFLRNDLVVRTAWLTDQQLIDAIAIGQVTPGPVFTTATFIGFVLAGFLGALVATLGIFLPSFFFVALSNPIIPHVRNSPWASSLLDGVNVASLGLMAAVTYQLGVASIIDPLTIGIALVSAVLLLRFKINSTWLIAGGAILGVVTQGGRVISF